MTEGGDLVEVMVFWSSSDQPAHLAEALVDADVRDGYASGRVLPSDISRLRALGLVVEPRHYERRERLLEPVVEDIPYPEDPTEEIEWLLAPRENASQALVSACLAKTKVRGEPLQEGGLYRIWATTDQALALRHELDPAHVWIAAGDDTGASAATQAGIMWEAVAAPGIECAILHETVETAGGEVVAQSARRTIFTAREDVASRIRRSGLARVVAPHHPPTLFLQYARRSIGLGSAGGERVPPCVWGAGEVVGIADTGVDPTHPDLIGSLLPTLPLTGDPHGHGTHLAGILVGDGTASAGRIQGVAQSARLWTRAIPIGENNRALPIDYENLLQEAYDAGVRVLNLSWGTDTPSLYTYSSYEVDKFLFAHQDMLVVVAAGNQSNTLGSRRAPPGVASMECIAAPATAKNVLTVGAVQSSRKRGGLSDHSYGAKWPESFPPGPIGQMLISGASDTVAPFSSRGPCDDGRLKPEIVAPGTDVLSARSSRAPLSRYWARSRTRRYAYLGGTSVSTAFVTAAAALVRGWLRHEKLLVSPSAALVKAVLICGSTPLGGAVVDWAGGFGRLSLQTSLPSDEETNLIHVDADTQSDRALHLGESSCWWIQVGPECDQLRVALVYPEPPSRAVQRQVAFLLWGPSNEHHFPASCGDCAPSVDRDNNTQLIHVANPDPGLWSLRLTYFNSNSQETTPLTFALAFSGKGISMVI